MDRLRTIAIVLAVTVLIGAGVFFYSQSAQRNVGWHAATVLPESQPLRDFSLIDQNGERFDRESLRGRWNLLFFGFTHCPDICPATLQQLALVQEQLHESGLAEQKIPGVILISVDPKRDTPAALNKYVSHFGKNVRGVTGSTSELDALTRNLGIFYEISGDGDDYSVNHSAAVIATNPRGEFAAVFSAPHSIQALTADLLVLIGH